MKNNRNNIRIEDILRELANRGYNATLHNVVKNGVVKEGIIILNNSTKTTPVFYVDDIINYSDNVNDIVEKIIKINDTTNFNVPDLTSRDFIKDHIFLGLQKSSNMNLVKRETDFSGIEVYLFERWESNNQYCNVKLTKEALNAAGLSEEDAWIWAAENTFKETEILNMQEILMGANMVDNNDQEDLRLYVVTNTIGYLGASAILNGDALRKFSRESGLKEVFVVPSSVHEMLVVPYEENVYDKINIMIHGVNESQVKPEERLADRAYLLNLATMEVYN